MTIRYFPPGIATGDAFCDREAEREALARKMLQGSHTWLMAPRRVGKTSLVAQVLLELSENKRPKVVHAVVDLLLTHDLNSLQKALLEGVGTLCGQLLPPHKRALDAVQKFFQGLAVKEVVVSGKGPLVRFLPGEATPEGVVEALQGLDRIAGSHDVRAVFVLDEFQQLGAVRGHDPLEAAIRHALERAQQVTYVFSGSNRHLMAQMFEDASRPLYLLCERMELGMIPAAAYKPFLEKKAGSRWRKPSDETGLDEILRLTRGHPYYTTRLCRRLWAEPKPPTAKAVRDAWDQYVQEEHGYIASLLDDLSPNQRAVHLALAQQLTSQPRGQAFLERLRVPSASVGQAVRVLSEKDLIYQDDEGTWRILDPAIRTYLESLG